eukprot:scaffold2019_cov129-Isochrysis_galbana.AAC.1
MRGPDGSSIEENAGRPSIRCGTHVQEACSPGGRGQAILLSLVLVQNAPQCWVGGGEGGGVHLIGRLVSRLYVLSVSAVHQQLGVAAVWRWAHA